jgi:lipopolysaccharide transport system ATP-binding protein
MGAVPRSNAPFDRAHRQLTWSTMKNDVLIRINGVSKRFCRDLKKSLWYGVKDTLSDLVGRSGEAYDLRPDEFWALKDISFELRRGECLGLLGRNGAGKTTLLKMLNGLIKPDRGRIEVRGRVGALIALGAGFNPVLTGRENIYVNGAVLGLSKKEIERKLDDIVDFAEIDKFIDAPVQSYSSGMQVRLGFAIATALEPDVILLDEVLAVGDAAFRSKCFDRIGRILADAAVIFVSHSESQIYRICNQAILLAAGTIVDCGSPESVLASYQMRGGHGHPDQTKVTDPRLTAARLAIDKEAVLYGGDLKIKADFESETTFTIGMLFVHFWRNGEFVCNGEASFGGDSAPIFGPGKSELHLVLKPINLQAGKYTLSFSAFDETQKRTILHWLHFSEVQVQGPHGGGSPYVIPMTLNVAADATRTVHEGPISISAIDAR